MKKTILKPIYSLLLMVMFVFSSGSIVSVYAATPIIQIDSDFSNLFEKMTHMTPGTTVTDYFTVKNISSTSANFYLTAETARLIDFENDLNQQKNSETVLSILDLKVVIYNTSNKSNIGNATSWVAYEGKADQISPINGTSALMEQQLKLGELASKQAVTIGITVSAPSSITNQDNNKQAKFWWTFTAEQTEESNSSSSNSGSNGSSSSNSSSQSSSSNGAGSSSANNSNNGTNNNGGNNGGNNTNGTGNNNGGFINFPFGGNKNSSSITANSNSSSTSLSDSSTSVLDDSSSTSLITKDIGGSTIPLYGTGAVWGLLNLVIAIIMASAGLILLIFSGKKPFDVSTPNSEKAKRIYQVYHFLAIAMGLLGILLFVLTNNITDSVVLTDDKTLIMVLIAVIQIVFLLLSKHTKKTQFSSKDDDIV